MPEKTPTMLVFWDVSGYAKQRIQIIYDVKHLQIKVKQ